MGERTEGEVVKLATERKHLSNLLKMVAYQIESDLVRATAPHYRRAVDEGRTLVQAALATAADITVATDKRELRVVLTPMSSPIARARSPPCASISPPLPRCSRAPASASFTPSPTPAGGRIGQLERRLCQEIWNRRATFNAVALVNAEEWRPPHRPCDGIPGEAPVPLSSDSRMHG